MNEQGFLGFDKKNQTSADIYLLTPFLVLSQNGKHFTDGFAF